MDTFRPLGSWWLALVLAATACASGSGGSAYPAGTSSHHVEERVGLVRRSYLVHVPPVLDPARPAPVVVMLHGAFSSAAQMERFTGLSELADREGFVAVYPNGIGLFGLLRHWNSGQCCAKALADDIDDVGFIVEVVERVAAELPVDRSRIYLAGHSNGGMMAYRVAAERSELVAAVAAVSATVGGSQQPEQPLWVIPRPALPVAVLVVHGTGDEHMPYEGGRGTRTRGDFSAMSVAESVALWRDINGCAGAPERELARDGRVELERWNHCAGGAEVAVLSLDGWPHSWPGPYFSDRLAAGDALAGYDALEQIWDFLRRHRRGGA